MRLILPSIAVALCLPSLATAQVSSPTQTIGIANLTAPSVGQAAVDPNFGVTVRRLTDRGSNGGLATAEYSQLQAVNADETRVMVTTDQGFEILDIATGNFTHDLPQVSMPRWDPTDADSLLGYNQRSGGNIVLQRYELMPNGMVVVSSVVDVDALGFGSLELGSWEDTSDDGRYVVLLGNRNGTDTAAVLDIMAGTIRSSVSVGDVDWAAISPSGNYFAVQYLPRGTGQNDGLVIYDAANGNFLGHAADHHEHGDLGRNAAGNDMFTTIAYTDFCANGNVACCSMGVLPDAIERNDLDNLYEVNAGTHTSCRAHQRPGFCLHSDTIASAGSSPFGEELWLSNTSNGSVLRLMHHRSSACSYYNEPRATLSPTGRYVLFTSDWASPNCSDQGDLYLIDTTPFLDAFLGGIAPPVDAGLPDTGVVPPFDSGVPFPDVGFDDGGLPIDAGFADTGISPDSGGPGPSDAGSADRVIRDGSSTPRGDDDDELRGGCGCDTRAPGSSGSVFGLLLVAGLLFRRRL